MTRKDMTYEEGVGWVTPPVPPGAAMRKARVRRRRILLWSTSPLVVVALVIGFKLAFLPFFASLAESDYDAGSFDDAAETYGTQRVLNIVDPWKAYFNGGTAQYRDESYYAAIDSLYQALDDAEGEEPQVLCGIQTNLSLSYEGAADDAMEYGNESMTQLTEVRAEIAARDAGQPYDEAVLDPYGDGSEIDPQELEDSAQDWFESAELYYATAEQIRGWPGCEDRSQEEQEQNDESTQRLQDKQQAAQDSQPQKDDPQPEESEEPDDGSESPDSGQSEEEKAEAERQEQLQQQNSEAQQDEDQSQQEYQDLYGPDSGGSGDETGAGSAKNW